MLKLIGVRIRAIIAFKLGEYKQHATGVRLGFLFSILEFTVSMLVIALLFTLIGKQAAFGESIVLFMVTGLAPFLTFMRASSQIGGVFDKTTRGNRSPLLGATAYAAASTLNFLVLAPICVALICVILYAFGINSAIPIHFEYLAAALFIAVCLGTGIGLLNASIGFHFKVWPVVFGLFTRGLLLASGIFFVPDTMPRPIVAVLEWNPLVHVIAIFRLGFYKFYPTLILDVNYLLGVTLAVLFIGLWAERLTRRSYNF